MKRGALACGLFVFLGSAVDAQDVAPTYSIEKNVAGVPRKAISNIYVPPDKSYAELTPEEKQRVRRLYDPPLSEEDEPPYPENGLRRILETALQLEEYFPVRGTMFISVSVNAAGEATSADIRRSPNKTMAQAVATVLMRTKYKPAVCHGSPCRMEYPFRFKFELSK
jgi:hypothetical protein